MRLIFLIYLLSSCYQPERNCSHFKTGVFEFEAFVGDALEKTTFVRNDTIEIDYYQSKIDTSTIRWINDCEYIIKKINPKNMAEEKSVHIKIVTTDKDTYIFEYSIVGQSKKQKGIARRIN